MIARAYVVNELKSALTTAKILGVKNPQTIAHYYKTEWEAHKARAKKTHTRTHKNTHARGYTT